MNNDVFKDNSWHFRNALVRAKYNNIPKQIFATTEYLEIFFKNLIFGEKNKLSIRNMLTIEFQSATNEISKSQNSTLDGTLNCNSDELTLLRFIKKNPKATQIETPALIVRGLLERENGKRNGKWVVKCNL